MATISNPLYGLENLFTALYSGDPETKRAERQSLIAKRNKDAELTDLRIQKQKAQIAAANAPPRDPATELSKAFFPDQAGPVMDYRKAGGVVQPQPETDEQPGIIGGYGMDRPVGYTPQREQEFNRMVENITASGLLNGKTNFEQLSKGSNERQQGNVVQEALAGLRPRSDALVVQGKPAFAQQNGSVLDLAGGVLNEGGQQAQARVGEIGARAGAETALGGVRNAQRGKIVAETLPQLQAAAPEGVTTPTGTVPVLGKDVSREATKPAAATNAKGWKMFTDLDGSNYRVNENAGLVQKKAGAGWQDVDSLPSGATHIGSNIGVKDNVRTSLVLGGAQNALDRMKEAEQQFGSLASLRGSPYVGKHPKGVVSEVMHGVGREMIPEEQLNKDTYMTGIVDEAIPVFTGGLRSSDSFRDFLMSQLPRSIGDDDATTKLKWDIFKKNITGQSNAFRNKFNSTPSFHATGETARPAAAPAGGAAPGGVIRYDAQGNRLP